MTNTSWSRHSKTSLILTLFKAYLTAFCQTCNRSPCLSFSVGRLGPNMQIAWMPKAFLNGICSPISVSELSASLNLESKRFVSSFLKEAARFGLSSAGASHWQFICITHARKLNDVNNRKFLGIKVPDTLSTIVFIWNARGRFAWAC